MNLQGLTSRKWFYPLVYIVLIVLSMWPPYTHIPYDPRNTQDVILSILKVSTQPYAAWGWVLHVATLGVIALAVFRSKVAGRVMATYFGLNYLLIAALQTHAVTEKYGLAVQTGALVTAVLLGLLWLWVAWKDKLQASFRNVPVWRWILLPLALLVFWSPVAAGGTKVLS
ncbi:MAG: hypothetical protein NTU91_15065, partial [Chloroflexi bacterium]|nr:hypothetical protein [Chloroflexota bacterium]